MFVWFCIVIFMWDISSGQYSTYDDNGDNLDDSKEIPLELLLRLNNITNMSELLGTLVEADEYDTDLLSNDYPEVLSDMIKVLSVGANIADNNDNEDTREKRTGTVLQPRPAGCTPGPQIVKLKQSRDVRLVYFPSCIQLPQCGGCCIQDRLVCRPVKIRPVDYQIFLMNYKGGDKLNIYKKDIVTVEKHVKCECGCLILETDCNNLQEYSAETCQCLCVNKTAPKACNHGNDTKVWNPDSCKCECRYDSECSTGYEFSHRTCRCESKSGQKLRRIGDNLRYRFKKKAGNRPMKVRRRLRKKYLNIVLDP